MQIMRMLQLSIIISMYQGTLLLAQKADQKAAEKTAANQQETAQTEAAPETPAPEEAAAPETPTVPEQAAVPEEAQPEGVAPAELEPTPAETPAPEQAAAPEIPSAPEEEAKAPEEEPTDQVPTEKPVDEIPGIDTLDLEEPQGNWLYKRVWWERAEAKYEKIRGMVGKILEARMAFFAKRAELDKSVLDPFYIKIGLNQGELQEVVSRLIDQLEKEREKVGVLDDQERDVLAKLEEEKKTFEQIKLDIDGINKADNSVDDALATLMDQINRVRGYEQEAWQNFKEIARVLDDKKARELFYKVEGALSNVNDVLQYLQQSFVPSFNELVKTLNKQVDRVQQAAQSLREKGIDLKKQTEQLIQEEPKPPVPEEPEEEGEEPELGLVAQYLVNPVINVASFIGTAIKTTYDYTVCAITWPFRMLFGPAEADQEEEEESEQGLDAEE